MQRIVIRRKTNEQADDSPGSPAGAGDWNDGKAIAKLRARAAVTGGEAGREDRVAGRAAAPERTGTPDGEADATAEECAVMTRMIR